MIRRELDDFGGYNPKPPDPTWRFTRKVAALGPSVEASAKHYVEARAIAARELSKLLEQDVAPQDVIGELVPFVTFKAK